MIEISHLQYSYGTKMILNDVSFRISKGSFHAIMGSNGCGKTTLLRLVSNMLKPDKGSIKVDRRDVSDYGARQLAQKMALVQQHQNTDLDFSAFEIVLMGRNPYQRRLQNESKSDMDIVEQSMRQTNTWHLRQSSPNQMSGGELQRVMIARALAQQTPILLLDEPTSNLDISHQLEIMDLLVDINSTQHKTILIVVHDLNLALRYCPRSILIHDCGLFFQGSTAEALSPDNVRKVFGVESRILDGNMTVLGLSGS